MTPEEIVEWELATNGPLQQKERTAMHFRCYQDLRGAWRWSLIAANGRIIADSAEGYSTEANLNRAIASIQELMADPLPTETDK